MATIQGGKAYEEEDKTFEYAKNLHTYMNYGMPLWEKYFWWIFIVFAGVVGIWGLL